MKYIVKCNQYSHEGSGFAYVESVHETKEAAEKHAAIVRPHQRFAIVEAANDNVKKYDNA